MPTPLETYIANSNVSFWIDGSRLAVGSDNAHDNSLLQGVKWVSHTCAHVYDDDDVDEVGNPTQRLPICYAHHLVVTRNGYDEQANLRWIEGVVTGPSPPSLCHVFHDKASEALQLFDGKDCNPEAFQKMYRGKTNTTFKEIMIILKAGYTRVGYLRRKGHVVLKKA
ncbi:hypothetical protein [Dyella choica]|uniref:Uncharacterized protein n=1 Tax=Dyella choica TaxID=1927959 RepID=A0A3S0RML8_9GAMM|nr:hypothetical protein [Dyella choica]RUL78764.1 hypothetical protein EKH80_02830 [Dyella choica]